MTFKKITAAALAAGSLLTVAAPAQAVVTTFATFSAVTPAANLRLQSTGNAGGRATDATIYTTSTASGTTVGATLVRFSFLQAPLAAYVTNVNALFTLSSAIAKNTPATPGGPGANFVQSGISGSMSFKSTTAIAVSGPNFVPFVYAAGSNLLTITTFTGADITGKYAGTSGGFSASTTGGDTVMFTSDFLDFTNTVNRDFALSLTSVTPGFARRTGPNFALNNFRANVSGQFSSDPAPFINGLAIVPEPATWALMIVGFGLVGVSARRRSRNTTVTA